MHTPPWRRYFEVADHTLHPLLPLHPLHLLHRYFEVAGLSWTLRKIAAAVFASPPTGTYDEALAHFMAAEKINPGFYIKNRLMIGECERV